jgi:Na+(H+)/acetate symporter ActP
MKKILALTAGMLLVASMAFARDIDTGAIELSGSSDGYFSSRSGDGTS